jgi:hypothetical protein
VCNRLPGEERTTKEQQETTNMGTLMYVALVFWFMVIIESELASTTQPTECGGAGESQPGL